MNVYFPSAETDSAKQSINVDRATTAYRTSTRNAERAGRSSFALDISGTVTDNSAYAGHGRTAEEVMRMAGQEDTKARRDYMAVMSNCMSDEDFAKLQEEGFHPGSTEIDTVVTIVDRIKAALVKGGTEVVGYTDTLSDEELCKITGSESFANELKNQFHDRDIPLTEENVQAITDTYEQIKNISKLSEGSEKYMVENRMEPTPEALYTAQYSAPQEGSRQGTGYYADGTVNGYYAKKPEQIEAVVRAAAAHTRKPVSVKIRLGVSDSSRNAVECALAAEKGGAAAVAVHGRTREQYYSGSADWKAIAEVRDALHIPVIANGDVRDAESAKNIMEETGCDYIMVGRSVRGNPWIFRDLLDAWEGRPLQPAPGLEEKKQMMLRQFRDLAELKGEYRAVRQMRGITGWYLKGVPGSAALRGRINQIVEPEELEAAISAIG